MSLRAVVRRLARTVPMQKAWDLPRMVHRAFVREEVPEPVVKPIVVREAFKLDVRALRIGIEAGPNAPQMIRLIRQPYGLQPGGLRREPAAARARVELRPAREPREGMSQARAAAERDPWPRASAARYRGMARPRPGLVDWSAWIGAPEGEK